MSRSQDARVETITPAIAQEWFDNRRANRPMSEERAEEWADLMRRGKWRCNGETIKFAEDGRMIDGQHRCRGVILSGCTIESFVVRNLPREAFDTLDQGRRRSLSHIFAIHKELYYAELAAALPWVDMYLRGLSTSSHREPVDYWQSLLRKHPRIRESAKYASLSLNRCNMIAPRSMLGAMHYLCSGPEGTFGEQASRIFADFVDGTNLSRQKCTSGFLLVRNRINSCLVGRERMSSSSIFHALVRAWNAMIAGRTLKQISIRPDEDPPEIVSWPRDGVAAKKSQ